MLYLKVTFFFFSVLALGHLLIWPIRTLAPKFSWLNLALAYGLGSFLITISLFFYLFVFKQSFSLSIFYMVLLLEGVLLFFFAFKRRTLPNIKDFYFLFNLSAQKKLLKEFWISLSSFKKITLSLIIFFVLFNGFFLLDNALTLPVVAFDSLAMWSWKTKILFYKTFVSFDSSSFYYLGGGGHLDYPWHIPLIQYWLQVNLGVYNDILPNLIFVGYFIAMLIVVFYFLRYYLDIFLASVFTFFLSSLPLFFYHSYNAYADLPLTFCISTAVAFFFIWLKSNKEVDFYLSAIFWGLAFWVKNDAVLFFLPFLITGLIMALKGKLNFFKFIKYVLVVSAVVAPWLIWQFYYSLNLSNVSFNLIFEPLIMVQLLGTMFISYSWNIWWYLVLIILVINFRRISKSFLKNFFWLFFLFSLLGLVALFSVSSASQYALDNTALSRVLMPLAGISIMAAGLSFSKEGRY
jgi:hypothetical protein